MGWGSWGVGGGLGIDEGVFVFLAFFLNVILFWNEDIWVIG